MQIFIELLNIIVSLFLVLFRIYEWRREMNKQGAELSRYLKTLSVDSDKNNKTINEFENREKELNQLFEISKYVALTIVVLTTLYSSLYCLAPYLDIGISGLITILSFIISSYIIKYLARVMKLNNENIHYDDIIFVISCVLCIPLTIRNWRIGLFALGITLGRHVWIDVEQKKKPVFLDIKNAFNNEDKALVTAIEMVLNYLMLYAVYAIFFHRREWGITAVYCMINVYIIDFMAILSIGNGLIKVTRATKNAVNKALDEDKN